MDVDGARPEVIVNQELFKLANAADSALQYFLDKNALLWMHNLIITFLELAIDLNVLDVQHGVMGELFFQTPIFDILYAKHISYKNFVRQPIIKNVTYSPS